MPVLDADFGPEKFCREVALSFSHSAQAAANDAANALLPYIHLKYRTQFEQGIIVSGSQVIIPTRLYFMDICVDQLTKELNLSAAAHCLLTRSTDGYVRQAALRYIIMQNQPWVMPYIVFLAGEYVIEILYDIVAAIPSLDKDAYIAFVQENREAMRLLRSRAVSYWNVYYRRSHPRYNDYPGIIFLNQLDKWAS